MSKELVNRIPLKQKVEILNKTFEENIESFISNKIDENTSIFDFDFYQVGVNIFVRNVELKDFESKVNLMYFNQTESFVTEEDIEKRTKYYSQKVKSEVENYCLNNLKDYACKEDKQAQEIIESEPQA